MDSQQFLDLHQDRQSAMLDHAVEGERAWMAEGMRPEHWTVPVPDAAFREIDAFLAVIRREPLPLFMLSPDQFQMDACREMMARVKRGLTEGCGMAVVDALPLDDLTVDEAKSIYWVLGQYLGMQVAQKWDGTMVYDVTNTGRTYGYGVRGSWTDVELFFHTDNSFAIAPPDFVSLLCLYPAKEGGISRICSLYTVHNEMLRRHPGLLKRLYQPFYYDRQAEHAPEDAKVCRSPAFHFDGKRLKARLSAGLVRKGYKLMGEQLDQEAEDAFAALEEIMNDPKFQAELRIGRGQIQFLNNREMAHFRSKFEDDENPEHRRHLIRLWYREQGRRFYNG